MADTKEDGEVLSEGELEEGELLSSDEEEVSEGSAKAKQAAPEPSKPVKADQSPQAAKRPAPEIEEAGAATLKRPRLEPDLQIKPELESIPDTAKEIFSDDEEAAYFPKLVKSRSLNIPPAPENTKSSPKGGQRDKNWQGSPQSSQEGSESGDYGSGSEHHGRGKRKSTDQEEEDRKGKSDRSDEKERKRDYSHHSRSDHYSSPRRSSRRDTYDKDRDRDKGGVSYRDQYGSRVDNYSKDRDHSRSGDEDGGSSRDQHGGRRDQDSRSRSKDRDQTANPDDGGTSYRNRDQYGYQKGGRRGHYHKQSPSHGQNPRQQQHQRYWDQSQSRSGGGYVAPGQMNTGMTAQQFHSLATKVAQRRERGLSLLPTPRNISACNNLDQFNYPAPPSWYLEAVEEWERERVKQTKAAAIEDKSKGESRGGELRQDEAMDIDRNVATGTGQSDAGKKDGSETTVAEGSLGVAADIAAAGVASEVSMATTTTTSSEMDVDTCSDKSAPDPTGVSVTGTGGETKSDFKRTEMETASTGPVLASEKGGNQAVEEQSKGALESSEATAVVGTSSSAAREGVDAIKEKLPGVPSEKTSKKVPLPKASSGADSDDNLSEPEVDDFDYDKYLDQLDEEEEEVGPSDFLANPLSEDFPRVGPADEKSTATPGKSAGPSLKSLVNQEIDLTVASDEAKDAPPPTKNDAKRPNKSARRQQKEAAWRARQQEREAAAAKKQEEAAPPRPKLPCRYFMNGFCRHGDNCSYSHAVPREKKKEICKFYLQNACSKGEECAYYHSKFPCKFFHTKSYCNFGPQCKFSHDPLTPETHELLMTVLEPSRDPGKLPVAPIPGYDGTRDGGSVPGGMQTYVGGIQTNTSGMQAYPGSIQTNPGGMQTYPGGMQVQGPPQSQIEPSGTHMQTSPGEGVRFNFFSSGGSVISTDPHRVGESQNESVARQQQQWETQPRGDGPLKESENGLVVSIPKQLAQESLVVSIPRFKLSGRFHSGSTAMPVAVVSVSTTQEHPAAVTVQSFGTGMGPQPNVPVPPLGFPPIPSPNPLVVPTQLSSQPIPLFPPKPKPLEVGQTSQVSSEPPRRALLPTPPPHMKLTPEDLKRMEMAQPEYWESPSLNQMQGPHGPASQPYPPQKQQTFYPQNGGGPVANNSWNAPAYNVRPHGMGPRPQRQGGMDPRQGNTDLRQEGMGPRPAGPEMGHGGFVPRPGGFDPRQGQADVTRMHVPPRPPAPAQPHTTTYAQPPPPPPPPPMRVEYQQTYQQPPYQQQQQPQWMGPDSIPHHPQHPPPPPPPPPQHPTPPPFHPRPDSHTQIPHPPGSGLPAPFGSLPPPPPEKTSPVWGLGTSPEHTGGTDSNYLSSPSADPRRVDPRTKYAHLRIKPKGQSASPQQQQPSSTSSILKKSASSSGKPSEAAERPEQKQEPPFKIPKLLQNPLSLDKPLDPRELFGSNAKGLEMEQEYGEITAPFGSFRPFFSRSSNQAVPSSSELGTGTKQPYGEITLERKEDTRRKSASPPPEITRTAPPETREEKQVKVSPSTSTPPQVPSYLASLDVGLGGGSDDLTIDSAFGSLGDKNKEQGGSTETSKESQTAKKLPSIFGLGLQ